MFCFLFGDDLKRAREWDLFVRFREASKLDIDPAEVDMLDPPWPDLKADVFGHSHHFELGEVVQQDWMKAQAQQEKRPIINSPLPLTAVWSPLESIIQKKATKKYAQQATPLSLLLYSERNAPDWAVIEPLVRERTHEIRASFENSVFDHSGFAWTSRRSMTLQSHSTEVTHDPPGTVGSGIVSAVAASARFLPEIVMNEAGLKFGVPSAEFTMPFAPVPLAGRVSVPVGVSETLLNLVHFPESARQAGSQ
jgi:hypothetical protein